MNKRPLLSFAITFLALVGLVACQPDAKPEPAPTDTGKETPANVEPAKPDPSTIPATAKTDAFEYYGLGCTDTLTYSYENAGTKSEGGQTCEFTGLDGQNAKFLMSRTGGLSMLGSEELVASDKGVLLVGAQGQALKEPVVALPASLAPGTTWESTFTVKDPGGMDVVNTAKQKVEATETVKTPAGEFECIVVSMSGTLKTSDRSIPTSGKSWYAKGIGTVKLTVNSKDAAGKNVTFNVVLTSKGPSKD